MNDQDFLTAFKAHTISHFGHREHIRLAFLVLREYGLDAGLTHLRQAIQHFATAHGAPEKYHETITVFWVRLVQHAITQTPDIDTFSDFERAHPHLFDTRLIYTYYSPERLHSQAARESWLDPDVMPLPDTL